MFFILLKFDCLYNLGNSLEFIDLSFNRYCEKGQVLLSFIIEKYSINLFHS